MTSLYAKLHTLNFVLSCVSLKSVAKCINFPVKIGYEAQWTIRFVGKYAFTQDSMGWTWSELIKGKNKGVREGKNIGNLSNIFLKPGFIKISCFYNIRL